MKLLIEILLNISGWNIMSNYKMGYTLIETILVIAIVFILGGITITLSIESINDYNLSLSNCYYEDKFDNALLNLESLCTSAGIEYIEANKELNDVYSSEVIGDNITVKFKDINNDEKIKIIYLNKEKLMIKTIGFSNGIVSVGNNVLIDKIENFSVKKKNKPLYEIKEDILTLSSEEYELLNEVKESVLKDNEIIKILKQYKEDRNLEFQYTFSKNNNMQFIIKENEMFI